MDIPTIFDVLDRLAFIRGMPSVVILLLAAFVAVVVWDMRVVIPAMLITYLFAGLLFVDILDPRLAVVYTLAGLFITAILLITARQVNWGRPPAEISSATTQSSGSPGRVSLGRFSLTERSLLRLALAVATLAGAWLAARSPGTWLPLIPEELSYLEPAFIGLAGLGFVGLATSAEPLPSGIGLLLFLSAFALYYGFLDQSIAMTVALIAIQLIASLVAAYLAQARFLPAGLPD